MIRVAAAAAAAARVPAPTTTAERGGKLPGYQWRSARLAPSAAAPMTSRRHGVSAVTALFGKAPPGVKAAGKGCMNCLGKGAVDCAGCKGTGKNKKNGNMFERWKDALDNWVSAHFQQPSFLPVTPTHPGPKGRTFVVPTSLDSTAVSYTVCYDCQGFGMVACPKCGTVGLTPEQRGER